MKTKEGIQCEMFFGGNVKLTRNPCCQHLKKRKVTKDNNFDQIFQKELRKE